MTAQLGDSIAMSLHSPSESVKQSQRRGRTTTTIKILLYLKRDIARFQ